ncbi:MAG TPA: LamG domain-containing protein [Labilithrix sp.]|nr:LamG domain-containing protein [Labilithrix sp.]
MWLRRFVLLAAAQALSACTLLVPVDGLTGSTSANGVDAASGVDAADGGPAAESGTTDSGGPAFYAATVLADSPVAYWRLGETSGTTVKDVSGRGNDGIAVACSPGASGAILNDPDTAMRFDGLRSSIASVADLTFAGNVSFSIEAWASPGGGGAVFQHIINKEKSNQQGYAIYMKPTVAVYFERYLDGTGYEARGPALTPNKFAHIVGTYDGATLSIYVNGVLGGIAKDTQTTKALATPFHIGAGETANFFDGVIDEVAVYDKALSPARILAHYRAAGR